MPKGIENHTVSLTKNGYQKLKDLIGKYPASEILDHLDEISLDRTQAMKMLAGNGASGVIPDVWDRVKEYPIAEQHALLMISIIFSHRYLIDLFAKNTRDDATGFLNRDPMEDKTYTNLAYAMNELGLAVNFEQGANGVAYDWQPILSMNIGPLVREVLWHHLENIGGVGDFYDECFEYGFNKVFSLTQSKFKKWLEGGIVSFRPRETILTRRTPDLFEQTKKSPDPISVKWEDFPGALAAAMADMRLKIDPFLQLRFAFSLLTKPFVILTGLAGSGKTKLAQAFAHWICEDEGQICMVPVGADWTNREPLLGYPNALAKGEYCKPDNAVLDLLLAAVKNADKPYFLILDEMNLSHVERYFADFLSAMESKGVIALHSGSEPKEGVPPNIKLPPNLYIIGTVNIDETTYMFSPKVLDRAQVIEFRVDEEAMSSFLGNPTGLNLAGLQFQGAKYGSIFVQKSIEEPAPINIQGLKEVLMDFFKELKSGGAEFGFRTATEMLRFIHLISPFASPLDKIIDAAVLQKLLPKLHGSQRKIGAVLVTLARLCLVSKDNKEATGMLESKKDIDYNDAAKIKFPLSLEKIVRMYKRAMQDGFTSYAEA